VVGGGRDYHQWTSVLYALSATRAFHHVYKGDYAPWKIADFLLLNAAFPRSVAFSYEHAGHCLDRPSATRRGGRNIAAWRDRQVQFDSPGGDSANHHTA